MLTKGIILERVTEEEFAKLREFWHKSQFTPKSEIGYARVIETTKYRSYKEMLRDFMAHPHAKDVNFFNPMFGDWDNVHACDLSNPKKVNKVAASCINCGRGTEYLKLEFNLPGEKYDSSNIQFANINGTACGYDVLVTPGLKDDFTLKGSFAGKRRVLGIWVP